MAFKNPTVGVNSAAIKEELEELRKSVEDNKKIASDVLTLSKEMLEKLKVNSSIQEQDKKLNDDVVEFSVDSLKVTYLNPTFSTCEAQDGMQRVLNLTSMQLKNLSEVYDLEKVQPFSIDQIDEIQIDSNEIMQKNL